MTGSVLLRQLQKLRCKKIRQKGSHVRVACGECVTTIPVHAGKDLPPGTRRAIRRDLEPCLGKGWLK